MNKIDNGGPAFPLPIAGCNDGGVYNVAEQSGGELVGMTLRDYFAAKAPISYEEVEHVYGSEMPTDDVGRTAWFAVRALLMYAHADAMLTERTKQ